MQNEKTTQPKTTNLVAALPNETLFKILCLIKKDHEAEISQIIEDYRIEAYSMKRTITELRYELKRAAFRAGLTVDRSLYQPYQYRASNLLLHQHGGGYAATPKCPPMIIWTVSLGLLAMFLGMMALEINK